MGMEENILGEINLIKSIDKQDSRSLAGYKDINQKEMSYGYPSNPVPTSEKFPYKPFVRKAMEKNFNDVAKTLKLDSHSVNTGKNFIESVIEYKQLKHPEELNKYAYNRNVNLEDTALISTYNCIIESYGRQLRKYCSDLNGIDGYNEEFFTTTASNQHLMDRFENELEKSTPEKLNEKIADRVEDATEEFIKNRNEYNDKIKDIYYAAQKVTNANPDNAEIQTQAQEAAKQRIHLMKSEPVSLFESMVTKLSNAALKNDELKSVYTENDKLNMNKIIDDVSAIYAVMEVCNVYGLFKMNEEFITDFLNGFE